MNDMNRISFEEALTLLRNYHPAVHAGQYEFYSCSFSPDNPDIRYYLTDGCVVIEEAIDFGDEWDGRFSLWYYIHEVEDGCDLATVTRECYERFETERPKHEVFMGTILLIHVGELSEQMNAYQGFRKFVRYNEKFVRYNNAQYEPDPHVVMLTSADAPEVNALCDPAVLENDTWFGKREAEGFVNWDFDARQAEGESLLGYRADDGRLLGVASWGFLDAMNLGFLRDLFVAPDSRGQGIGKALVKTALSNLPEKVWLYQSARDNEASVALAKSLGFTFEGAELYVHNVN